MDRLKWAWAGTAPPCRRRKKAVTRARTSKPMSAIPRILASSEETPIQDANAAIPRPTAAAPSMRFQGEAGAAAGAGAPGRFSAAGFEAFAGVAGAPAGAVELAEPGGVALRCAPDAPAGLAGAGVCRPTEPPPPRRLASVGPERKTTARIVADTRKFFEFNAPRMKSSPEF